jgi:toxin ParE1/3/4
MARIRLSRSAEKDIFAILVWSQDRFGDEARSRYQALVVAALLHAAENDDGLGFRVRPELGGGVLTWHLAQSVSRSRRGVVRRPRHLLVCRRDGGILVVGRILHDTMDPILHLDSETDWR